MKSLSRFVKEIVIIRIKNLIGIIIISVSCAALLAIDLSLIIKLCALGLVTIVAGFIAYRLGRTAQTTVVDTDDAESAPADGKRFKAHGVDENIVTDGGEVEDAVPILSAEEWIPTETLDLISSIASSIDDAINESYAIDGTFKVPEEIAKIKSCSDMLTRIADASRRINGNVGQAHDLSTTLTNSAQDAFELAGKVQKGIQMIVESLEHTIKSAGLLSEQSRKILRIVDIMADISGKTHVLSINASIVAARAGKHGKAFEVVAKEIRELAMETEVSLKEIGEIVEEIQETITAVSQTSKAASEETSVEKDSLLSVAGSLQGVVLSVEIIHTVSDAAQETAKEQIDFLESLKGNLMNIGAYLQTVQEKEEMYRAAKLRTVELLTRGKSLIKELEFTLNN